MSVRATAVGEARGVPRGKALLSLVTVFSVAVVALVALCAAIGGASVPRGFDGSPVFDNLTTGLLMIFVLWFGLQLGLKMLYRVGLLWILIVTAPLALACWAVPQAQPALIRRAAGRPQLRSRDDEGYSSDW